MNELDHNENATILVIDDNPDNLRLLVKILSEKGYRVRATRSCKFAFESIKNEPPDLILLDVLMPEMDGYEVCGRLKADPVMAAIPVIFISAKNDITDETKGLELGAVDYIIKPISPSILLARVKTHLKLKFSTEMLQNQKSMLEDMVYEKTKELVKKNLSLENLLNEKETLLRELFHRTKNNMNTLISLLQLHKMYHEHQNINDVIDGAINQISAMALVHAKLYKSKDLSNIAVKEYIEDLVGILMSFFSITSEQVNVVFDLDDITVLLDIAIPLGMIINEIMTNCFKYAFPDGRKGEINITLKSEKDDVIRLIIKDNGVGLDAGINPEKTDTLGFTLINQIVKCQLAGTLQWVSDKGLSFVITFWNNLYHERV